MRKRDVVIGVFGAAHDAVRRIGEVGDALGIDLAAHAIEDDVVINFSGNRGDHRVIRVEAKRRMRRVLDARHDVFERMRDLAIAIELVAKDVRDDENVGVDLLAYATQGTLVALDGGELVTWLARHARANRELGRYALDEVRATAVVERLLAHVLECLGDDMRGSRFSVGARDDDGAHAATKLVQIVWVDLESELAGQ